MRIRNAAPVLAVLSVFALASCGSSQPGNASAEAGNASQAKVSAPAAQTGNYHAQLALAGSPAVTADGKDVVVAVNVTNDGPAPFGTQAAPTHNVNLGAHAIDSAGKVVDNDLARGSMPEVAPGAIVKATILLPVDKLLGHSAELLPVEEGVGWFDQWGTKPLVVGPFEMCSSNAAGKVCDASGKPLPVAAPQQ
ncbi:MAG: hypothetical protein ACRETC_07345 [Gammaproteobacteria bacterium]